MIRLGLTPRGELLLELADNHSVEVPCTIEGLRIVRHVLQQREAHGPRGLGSSGSPTQAMIQAFVKANGVEAHREIEAAKRRADAKRKAERRLTEFQAANIEISAEDLGI